MRQFLTLSLLVNNWGDYGGMDVCKFAPDPNPPCWAPFSNRSPNYQTSASSGEMDMPVSTQIPRSWPPTRITSRSSSTVTRVLRPSSHGSLESKRIHCIDPSPKILTALSVAVSPAARDVPPP